jgi:hypothetical protein
MVTLGACSFLAAGTRLAWTPGLELPGVVRFHSVWGAAHSVPKKEVRPVLAHAEQFDLLGPAAEQLAR